MSTTKLIGTVLAAVHLLAFLTFVLFLHQSDDGQTILLWALWLPVDFPVSLTVLAGFELLPSDDGIGSMMRRALPYFVHGALGTIWWYFLPFLIAAVFKKITGNVN